MPTGQGPVGALAALPVGRLQKAEVTRGVQAGGWGPILRWPQGGPAQAGSGWVSAAAQQGLRRRAWTTWVCPSLNLT